MSDKIVEKNPFAGIPTSAKLDPRTVTISEYSKYTSSEIERLNSTFRTFKNAKIYLGGCIVFWLAAAWYANKKAYSDLFGSDYCGGKYLFLKTPYDEDHYTYNREFQRMFVVGEAKIGDLSHHSEKLIRDTGGEVPLNNGPFIRKKAPHEKFY